MRIRYWFYNQYPATETNEACLWHQVNHPVPMTSFSTGWNTNRYKDRYAVCLHPPPVPRILSPFQRFIRNNQTQNIELMNTQYS